MLTLIQISDTLLYIITVDPHVSLENRYNFIAIM